MTNTLLGVVVILWTISIVIYFVKEYKNSTLDKHCPNCGETILAHNEFDLDDETDLPDNIIPFRRRFNKKEDNFPPEAA